MKEEVAEGERGSLKIQLKPQKGRSAIVSMLFKGLEDKKFSQKSQVVVKPPTILAVDAMVIVKFLSCKFMDGEIDLEAMKAAKYDLLEAHQQGKLLDRLKSELDPNNPSNQEFLGIVELRQTLTLDTSGGQHDGRADGKPTPGTGRAVWDHKRPNKEVKLRKIWKLKGCNKPGRPFPTWCMRAL